MPASPQRKSESPLAALGTSAGKIRFRRKLLHWYDSNRRELPWRRDRDPYRVWVSEIMLQQTRVAAVVEHYHRFLERFPAVAQLARAREASILAAWSGLGYYRRARMLHAAAKEIVRQHAGKFPANADSLRLLPGIGRYTAAAVASIAFHEPVAVVDGNVERVLERVLGRKLCGEENWQWAERLLSQGRPGDFNQAMMELGATVCLPRGPKCLVCPVFKLCVVRGELSGTGKPARQNKQQIHYALDCQDESVFLVQRARDASLMPRMWELPEIPGPNGTGDVAFTVRHSITVTDYLVKVVRGPAPAITNGQWVSQGRLPKLPLTGLTRKILRTANVI